MSSTEVVRIAKGALATVLLICWVTDRVEVVFGRLEFKMNEFRGGFRLDARWRERETHRGGARRGEEGRGGQSTHSMGKTANALERDAIEMDESTRGPTILRA